MRLIPYLFLIHCSDVKLIDSLTKELKDYVSFLSESTIENNPELVDILGTYVHIFNLVSFPRRLLAEFSVLYAQYVITLTVLRILHKITEFVTE
jgi:hypothetical protein